MIAVVGWGAAVVFGKKLSLLGYHEKEIMAGRFSFGFISLAPLLFWMPVSLGSDVSIWGRLTLMVLLSGIVAMYLYYHGLKTVSARLCALAEMFFPFFAVIVNWVFLDASLDIIQI